LQFSSDVSFDALNASRKGVFPQALIQPLAPAACDVGRDPPRLNSDTSDMADNRHTEKKYEHTN
jgi:hypothetical protein